jgi:hypothetical protein
MESSEKIILYLVGLAAASWIGMKISKARRHLTKGLREKKNAAVEELVHSQLEPGEQLLCVDRPLKQPLAGLMILFMGLAFVALSATVLLEDFGEDIYLALGLFLFFGFSGAIATNFGLSVLVARSKGYFFVTNKRLAVRLITFTWKWSQNDYPPEKIKKVEVVAVNNYGSHIADRVEVSVDVGKKKPKIIRLVTENNAQAFANAVQKITSPSSNSQHPVSCCKT